MDLEIFNNQTNDIFISVIMPAYNAENYIQYSIESVLCQSHDNLELIIIDDGSSDSTAEIIAEFAAKDSRLRYVKNEINLGVSETRNKGISLAISEWIAFIDSDDIWKFNKLEKQLNLVKTIGAEFVYTGVSYIDETGGAYRNTFKVSENVTYEKLLKHNIITCSSVLVKKKYVERIKMERDDMHEDYAVWLRVLNSGLVAQGINEPLLIYRISSNSKSGNKLKSLIMTYKVYRFLGIKRTYAVYYTFSHTKNSVIKYKKIFN